MPKLIIVDDEPCVLEVLVELLENDFNVQAVTDPGVAIKMLDEPHFDMVISDLRMPKVSGVEVLKHARQRNPRIITILTTGQSKDEPEVTSAIATVADEFISKPFDEPDKIVDFLHHCFKKGTKAA